MISESFQRSHPPTPLLAISTTNTKYVYFLNLFLVDISPKTLLFAVRTSWFRETQPCGFSETRITVMLTAAGSEPRVPHHFRTYAAQIFRGNLIHELIVVTTYTEVSTRRKYTLYQ